MAIAARPGEESAQQILEEFEQFEKDVNYLYAHRAELVKEHPDEWVGVFEEKVIGTAKSLPQLLKKIDRQQLPRGRVFTHFLATKQLTMIL